MLYLWVSLQMMIRCSNTARLEWAREKGFQKGPPLPHTGFVWAPQSDRPTCTACLAHHIATDTTSSTR